MYGLRRTLLSAVLAVLVGETTHSAVEVTADSLRSPWIKASEYEYKEAYREFRTLQEVLKDSELRRARFGEALMLLNVQPKTVVKIERAREIFSSMNRTRKRRNSDALKIWSSWVKTSPEPNPKEEKLRRLENLEQLGKDLTYAPAIRDFNYVVGVACLSLDLSKERALDHLLIVAHSKLHQSRAVLWPASTFESERPHGSSVDSNWRGNIISNF